MKRKRCTLCGKLLDLRGMPAHRRMHDRKLIESGKVPSILTTKTFELPKAVGGQVYICLPGIFIDIDTEKVR